MSVGSCVEHDCPVHFPSSSNAVWLVPVAALQSDQNTIVVVISSFLVRCWVGADPFTRLHNGYRKAAPIVISTYAAPLTSGAAPTDHCRGCWRVWARAACTARDLIFKVRRDTAAVHRVDHRAGRVRELAPDTPVRAGNALKAPLEDQNRAAWELPAYVTVVARIQCGKLNVVDVAVFPNPPFPRIRVSDVAQARLNVVVAGVGVVATAALVV